MHHLNDELLILGGQRYVIRWRRSIMRDIIYYDYVIIIYYMYILGVIMSVQWLHASTVNRLLFLKIFLTISKG